jgi:predicted nucleotidyltransferase
MTIDQKLSTTRITPELLDYIVQKIVQEIQPTKIILFGSYARGDFSPDSDLDLFIIIDTPESSRVVRRKIDALLWGRMFALDLIVRNLTEVQWNLKTKNPFYMQHILKEGKVLYEKK